MPDYYDLKEKVSKYFQELNDIKPANEKLTEQVSQLTMEKSAFGVMAQRYETLLEIMTDWRMAYSGDSSDEARAYIEAEVTEYTAILNDD